MKYATSQVQAVQIFTEHDAERARLLIVNGKSGRYMSSTTSDITLVLISEASALEKSVYVNMIFCG